MPAADMARPSAEPICHGPGPRNFSRGTFANASTNPGVVALAANFTSAHRIPCNPQWSSCLPHHLPKTGPTLHQLIECALKSSWDNDGMKAAPQIAFSAFVAFYGF